MANSFQEATQIRSAQAETVSVLGQPQRKKLEEWKSGSPLPSLVIVLSVEGICCGYPFNRVPDQAEHLLRRFHKGNILKTSLHLRPLLTLGVCQPLRVLLKSLMENCQHQQRRLVASYVANSARLCSTNRSPCAGFCAAYSRNFPSSSITSKRPAPPFEPSSCVADSKK